MELIRQRLRFCEKCDKKRYHNEYVKISENKEDRTTRYVCKCGEIHEYTYPTTAKINVSDLNSIINRLDKISSQLEEWRENTFDKSTINRATDILKDDIIALRDKSISIYRNPF